MQSEDDVLFYIPTQVINEQDIFSKLKTVHSTGLLRYYHLSKEGLIQLEPFSKEEEMLRRVIYAPIPLLYFFLAEKKFQHNPFIIYLDKSLSRFTKHHMYFSCTILYWEKFRLGSDVESPTFRRALGAYFKKPPTITIGTWEDTLHSALSEPFNTSKIYNLSIKT